MKTKMFLLGTISLLLVFLTGCGGQEAAPAPAPAPVGEVGGLETGLAELGNLEEDLGTEDLEDLEETLNAEF